jgi:CHAD domain-containing protein
MELDYVKLKELKPVLTGYIRESQLLLKKSVIPDEKTVHDVRVLMKKSRAVLKLSAPQLDKTYPGRDIASLKQVGRILCSWRETSVQRKTLKELRKENPKIFSRLSENVMLSTMLEKHEPVREPSEEIKSAMDLMADLLNKTGYRIRFLSMNSLDPQLLLKELEITYSDVADIYLNCRNNPKPESLHNFRKRAKDFLYQLYIFRPLNPSVVRALEKKLDSMTLNLGKFNDLTQIVKDLGYNYKMNENLPAMDELIVKIRGVQDRYLAKIWPSAYQIFCPGNKLVNVLGFKLLVI